MTTLVVGSGVTAIKASVFSNCPNLTTVQWNAHHCADCSACPFPTSVSSVIIGEEVEYIPAYLCKGLSKMNAIVIPSSVSNIGKYASRDEPIRISREISGNMLAISFENRICRTASAGESTRIGLKTCETIMKLLSGEFEYQTDGELFTATVKLPIQTEE